ncbi:MAG: SGNH/GDSL hydrolase family protein [Desulfatirhabdiaceae bacterium]
MKRSTIQSCMGVLIVAFLIFGLMGTGFTETEEVIVEPETPEDTVDPLPEPEPVPVAPAAPSIALGFGDSITVGYPYITTPGNGQRIGGYEPTLEAALNSTNGSWQVLNWGVFGENTFDGLNRFDSTVSGYPGAYILILEGTNDIWSGISPGSTVYNLGIMIDKSRNAGLSPILATLTPDQREGGVYYKNIPVNYNPAIVNLAASKEVPLCDQYNAMLADWDTLNYDGLHPNSQGYQVMGNAWHQTMIGISPSPPAPGPDSGGSGGCFIATAAFGSPIESRVRLLKQFRDSILLRSTAGQTFVNWYYKISPPLAHVIARHDVLRLLVRWMLMPVIAVVWLIMRGGGLPSLAGCLGFLIVVYWVFAGLSAIQRRRKRLAAS